MCAIAGMIGIQWNDKTIVDMHKTMLHRGPDGKGYYQLTYNLSDGSAIVLSSGTYYTPNGVSLAGVGITPDVELELDPECAVDLYFHRLDPELDDQLQAALDLFR